MKKIISSLIILAILLFIAIIAINYLLDFFNYGLRGRYYAGSKWEGDSLLEGIDSLIQFQRSPEDYKEEIHPINSPPFSVEWRGYIDIKKAGLYSFATNSDDGSLLYIDNKLVVDNDGPHPETYVSGSLKLEKGVYPLLIRYFDIGIQGKMELYWKPPEKHEEIIPSQVLSLNKSLYLTEKISKYRQEIGNALKILKGLETGLLTLIFLTFLIRRYKG
jgi:fermentation-respiration switch protein FrsA (DUF1100 family)